MTADTTYADTIRKKNHAINPEMHPHLDNNSISSRIMQITGYRPTPDALIALMINEAKALTRTEIAWLIEGLKAIEPRPHPVN
ncbi:MAG: hypothetical protein EON60_06530 [Alphaproteobacteria bacterium]|nr:MAG: hypothetical protein EON60_06530 [Alphaproteobacteria bacterium]